MFDTHLNLFNSTARSKWLRLRTLILLRWLAIAGQLGAIIIATRFLEINLRLDLCASALGLSVAFNIIATVVFPANNRLSEQNAILTLMFDLFQLAFLVSLTGGLSNPFVFLMLAPVTVSAAALTLRATVIIGLVFISLISLLVVLYVPLTTMSGELIQLPNLLIYGTWAALVTSGVFLAAYAHRVTEETFSMSEALTATQLALGREQRLTALGGVVAATAHELGTPLATIKLVAAELADELEDRPHLYDDANLISTQADRCRDILRDMGRAGKDDTHLHHAPISAVIEEAAAPHMDRGKMVMIRIDGALQAEPVSHQPEVPRQPEIIHGLRNLVQNAVDFARTQVWIDIDWDETELRIHVGDDGMGYPPDLIGKIGDPFVRKRTDKRKSQTSRPEYEGMGLGLFIAKTLLERSGARLTFANGSEVPGKRSATPTEPAEFARPTGAIVEVVWIRSEIEAIHSTVRGPLGENRKFD
ncbi:two-component sensor histidine kinase [Rhodobacterales bacterium 52_120_T64]|nr:two-component sensor histidine kinase [Rhodobacterales bacterium 52_120_T64]